MTTVSTLSNASPSFPPMGQVGKSWDDYNPYGRKSDYGQRVCPKCNQAGYHQHQSKRAFEVPFEVMVLTLDMGYPVGVECQECRQGFEDGDIVLAGQKSMVGWIGWHTRCLKGMLDDSPLDEFETTKQKLENGENPFE